VTDELSMTFEALEKPIDNVHKEIMGEYVLLMLIYGHVAAALYHHVILKDRTLIKNDNKYSKLNIRVVF
jgi:cytochrome b561